MRNIIFSVFHLVLLSEKGLSQSESNGYIIFISERDNELDISSVFYLEPTSDTQISNQTQVFRLGEKYFQWKYLNLPTGNADLVDCCELQVSSTHKRETIEFMEEIGEVQFDSLSMHYEQLYSKINSRFDLFLDKINRGLMITKESYLLHIFSVNIELCDCQSVKPNGEMKFPLGYESYLKKVNKIYKMSKEQIHFFGINFSSLVSVQPIELVIDDIKSRKR